MIKLACPLLMCCLLNPNQALGEESPAVGWYWYEDPAVQEEEEEGTLKVKGAPQSMEVYRKTIEEALHTAILNPTEKNLLTYMSLQKEMMNRSQQFSDLWQQTVLRYPELNPEVSYPTTQKARHVYLDTQHQETETIMKDLSQDYGLFFFYRGNCPYCHAFAPIVKSFAQKYGWSVLAISMDGSILPEFPEAQTDNGLAQKLNMTVVPALILANPKEEEVFPLSHGMVSEQEILQSIQFWFLKKKEVS